MPRETREERLVRGMFDQVSEHLHDLQALTTNPSTKELDVERWCHGALRNCLGFTATNGYTILSQETRGKMKPDLLIMKAEKPVLVVEVKRLGFDLNKSDLRSGKLQLNEYLHSVGTVSWGILTNGFEWRLFDFSDPAVGGIELVSFDLRNESDALDLGKKCIEEACWNLLDLHESTYSSNSWAEYSKEATAFSPESLAKAILSVDNVKHIAKLIRGEYEYKANTEVLIEKIHSLLVNGLDDSVTGWSETKQSELTKYIKAQKRAGRRRKQAAKNDNNALQSEESEIRNQKSIESDSAKDIN